jgi:hypothetical protein
MSINPSRAIVFSSLLFAGLMITASIKITDSNLQNTVNLFILAIWYVPFAYFSKVKTEASE